MTEQLAVAAAEARDLTRQHFGRAIGLYAPLYISNYCENNCVYCGFNCRAPIPREKLSLEEIEAECSALKKAGIQSVLLLTGESRACAPVSYLKDAVLAAKKYFPNVSLEIYPLETNEYRELYLAGADGVTLYQETYDKKRYLELHLSGKKRDYEYRYEAPGRVAAAGFRHISLGALLGLADWRRDVPALFSHLAGLWKEYPGVEFSLSFPRLRKIAGDPGGYFEVNDLDMLRIVTAARLRFPRAGLNLSTRESAAFRNRILEFGVTRISAGSSTGVGGYVARQDSAAGQFAVNDRRSVREIKDWLRDKGFDPVMTEWRSIPND
jgi:2-iminoacetate synthase